MKAYPLSLDGMPPPMTKPSRWRRFLDRHLPSLVIYLMVITLVAVVLYPYFAVTVPSGHDIWGHLPFLFDETYSEYLLLITGAILRTAQGPLEVQLYEARKELARVEAAHAPASAIRDAHQRLDELEAIERASPQLSTRLSRLFLWSIEFGLVGTSDDFLIIGAAILSAPREAYGVLKHPPQIRSFTTETTDHEILFTEPQRQLFVAPDFETYRHVLDQCLVKYGSRAPADRAVQR